MQAKIQSLTIVHESTSETRRPFQIALTLHGFVTRKEMEILQSAKIQGLSISSIGCNKFQRQSKNEGKDRV